MSSVSETAVADLSPTTLAQELLVACKRGDAPERYRAALARADDTDLRRIRTDRRAGLAFWLNCYNAGTQLLLDEQPERYESPLRSVRFFWAPAITVAGTDLSLDRIENGLLRAGRSKYSLGYLPKVFVTSFEHRYSLEECDPRVHFALNCGAESCPAIRAYEPENVDDQLDLATRSYLDANVAYDHETEMAMIPRVFRWFQGDFGGRDGIREFLRRYDAVPADVTPDVEYQPWDWSLAAEKFAEQ